MSRVIVNQEICGQCFGCATLCKKNHLKVTSYGSLEFVNPPCSGCGLCQKACPVAAITVIENNQ
ncbi:MAG: 4Fe-4S binding protein [Candidatus Hodarchaeota archaeon]